MMGKKVVNAMTVLSAVVCSLFWVLLMTVAVACSTTSVKMNSVTDVHDVEQNVVNSVNAINK